jgi:hypothetical protein
MLDAESSLVTRLEMRGLPRQYVIRMKKGETDDR